MSERDIYQVEVGVLLDRNDEEFFSYNNAFDKQWGYYDENIWFTTSLKLAKSSALKYVKDGVPNTYAIISKVGELSKGMFIYNGNIVDHNHHDYDCEFISEYLEDTIESYAKLNNKIVKHFLQK